MNNPAANCEVSNTNTIIQNAIQIHIHPPRSKLRGILSIKFKMYNLSEFHATLQYQCYEDPAGTQALPLKSLNK